MNAMTNLCSSDVLINKLATGGVLLLTVFRLAHTSVGGSPRNISYTLNISQNYTVLGFRPPEPLPTGEHMDSSMLARSRLCTVSECLGKLYAFLGSRGSHIVDSRDQTWTRNQRNRRSCAPWGKVSSPNQVPCETRRKHALQIASHDNFEDTLSRISALMYIPQTSRKSLWRGSKRYARNDDVFVSIASNLCTQGENIKITKIEIPAMHSSNGASYVKMAHVSTVCCKHAL